MRPPFPYFGGKQRIAEKIVALLPPHDSYVEPFCGGLSVLLAKPPSLQETVNDLDGDLMCFWRVLRDRGDELARLCALTPHSRAESIAARDLDGVGDLERARRVWVMLTQRRGGQLRRTGWRYNINPHGTSLSLVKYLDGYLARFAPVIERLRNVSLECRDALEVIDAYGRFDGTLLYVDPPYLGSTRGTTSAYRHEMKGEQAHVDLAVALHDAKGAVVLSGYASDLYDDLYSSWWRYEIRAFTGQGSTDRKNGSRVEVLWFNRPLAAPSDIAMFDLEEVAS